MKTVIITGAKRGIGKATAETFLEHGWKVIGTSTSGDGWEHEHISWVPLQLTDAESIAAAVTVFKEHGPIDALINNAGVWASEEEPSDTVLSMDVLRNVLEVNLLGTVDLTEQVLAAEILVPDGDIVSIGSMAGEMGGTVSGSVPAYKISKVGLHMYSRTLAARLATTEMTISVLDPGWVQTDMGGSAAPRLPEEVGVECFDLVVKDIPSGKFWREGSERSW